MREQNICKDYSQELLNTKELAGYLRRSISYIRQNWRDWVEDYDLVPIRPSQRAPLMWIKSEVNEKLLTNWRVRES